MIPANLRDAEAIMRPKFTVSAVPDKGKTLVLRTTFVFVAPDKQTTMVQVSADKGQTWTTTIRVTAVKAA
jgi:hypothetical protein